MKHFKFGVRCSVLRAYLAQWLMALSGLILKSEYVNITFVWVFGEAEVERNASIVRKNTR